jgi:hypothetical protein
LLRTNARTNVFKKKSFISLAPELSTDPQPPYTPEAFPIIRQMVEQRASVLLEAAEINDSGLKKRLLACVSVGTLLGSKWAGGQAASQNERERIKT